MQEMAECGKQIVEFCLSIHSVRHQWFRGEIGLNCDQPIHLLSYTAAG
jgi:hypothetical protein